MTTEARNVVLVVGSSPAFAPEARNVVLVVGSSPAFAPEARNVVLVVGSDDPDFVTPAGSGWVSSSRRRRAQILAQILGA
jgi:hypothetical protein